MTKFAMCGWALVAGGALAVGGAVLNVDAFMNSPKAEPFVNAFGRTGARVFYVVLGLGVMALGGMIVWWGSAAGN